MKPHKHAELIKAWADGAEIEWVYATEGDGTKLWALVDSPAWKESHEYRIKPAPKPCNGFCGEQECKENQKNCERARMARKLLGSGTPQTKPDVVAYSFVSNMYEKNNLCVLATLSNAFRAPMTSMGEPNLKLTFDGETGELKSAEVLK